MLPDLSLDDIVQALSAIDSTDQDVWYRVGTAIKTEFGEDGFAIWDEWSARAGNYDARAARSRWKSLRSGRVSIGYLINLAKRNGHKFNAPPLSEDEKARRRKAQRERRAEIERQVEADEAALLAWQERVAEACAQLDRDHLSDSGTSAYLQRKKVAAFGLRFVRYGVIILTDIAEERIDLITGKEAIDAFFRQRNAGDFDVENTSFRYLKYGTIAVPGRDAADVLWGFQFINPQGGKKFLKFGRKQGTFHVVRRDGCSDDFIGVAEGYATSASVLMANGWPTYMAFDAGNLETVARVVRERHGQSTVVICADDDHGTKGNPGRRHAQAAARAVGGLAVWPSWPSAEAAA